MFASKEYETSGEHSSSVASAMRGCRLSGLAGLRWTRSCQPWTEYRMECGFFCRRSIKSRPQMLMRMMLLMLMRIVGLCLLVLLAASASVLSQQRSPATHACAVKRPERSWSGCPLNLLGEAPNGLLDNLKLLTKTQAQCPRNLRWSALGLRVSHYQKQPRSR